MHFLSMLAILSVLLVVLFHISFMVLEMFFWTSPFVRQLFTMSPEKADDSQQLAANVGLYNGFIAAGLLWGLWLPTPEVLSFFLVCIVIAGVYAGLTTKRLLLWIQALPALAALLLVWVSHYV